MTPPSPTKPQNSNASTAKATEPNKTTAAVEPPKPPVTTEPVKATEPDKSEVTPVTEPPKAPKSVKDEPKKPVTVLLSASAAKKLKLLAHLTGTTLSAIVVEALTKNLDSKIQKALSSLSDEG
jgi:hypothetical protein